MNKLKIVIISRTIYPRLAPRSHRATELAKELARRGHQVTLYALLGSYDYSQFIRDTGVIVKNLGKSRFGNINSDSKTSSNLILKALKKMFGRFIYFPDIELIPMVKKVIKKEKSIDYLITVAVPFANHFGAALARQKYGQNIIKCWVSDCGDPFMGNSFEKYPFYFSFIEKWWCRKTDFITIPIEEARNGYYKEFHHKLRVIPQGFDFFNIQLADYKGNNIPHFAYSGNVYPYKRDPSKFLEYLCSLVGKDFRFIVYTQTPEIFQKYKSCLKEKLIINSFIPRENLLKDLSKMDFLINIRNNSTTQQPSKLIDYYLTKRPILEIGSSFEEKEYFDEFLDSNYSHKLVQYDISQYDISKVADKFLELYRLK